MKYNNNVFDCGSMIITIGAISDLHNEEQAEMTNRLLEPTLEALDNAGWDFNLLADYNDFATFVKDNGTTSKTTDDLFKLGYFLKVRYWKEVHNLTILLNTPKAGIKLISANWPSSASDGHIIIMTSRCHDSLAEKDVDLSPIGISDEGVFYETTGIKPQIIRGVVKSGTWSTIFFCEVSDLYGDSRTPDWLLGIIKHDIEDEEEED